MNIYLLLSEAARRFAERGAVYLGERCCLTFSELDERARRIGAALAAAYPPGSRIAVASENCPEYVELMFGAWAGGMVLVPINAKLHPREMAQIAEDAAPAAIFVSAKLADGLREALAQGSATAAAGSAASAVSAAPATIVIGGPQYAALAEVAPGAPAEVSPDTLAWLFYTSGTTGRSKGAMLTHRSLIAMTVAHLADVETIDESMSQIHAAPMSHGSGMYAPAYLSRGARQVIPASQGFEPDEFLALCDVHPGCGAFLAPTMVQRLRVAAEASGHRPANLRSIVYGGGPMYVEELRKSMRCFGQVFAQIYGQGESPMTITGLRRADHALDDDAILGSVGWARTGLQVRVVDADGRPVPDGEIGEIVCRGDVVMSGYWNNPAATAAALRGGWLWTGDMGSLDARGYLTLRDRSKDVVISGGSNIYPREVEEVLLRHPAVAEVCVVGQTDDEWGEVVVAFVVTAPGAAASHEVLDAFCLEQIARFKRPKRYLFVESLPKNSYGKVLKRELRASLAASVGGG